MFNKKLPVLTAIVIASSLALTGCANSTMGSTTTEVISVQAPNLANKNAIGEEAQKLFDDVVVASGQQAEETGWTEKLIEGANVMYVWYDPSAPEGKQTVNEIGSTIVYRTGDEAFIYPFFIQSFLAEFSYSIKLNNGAFTITSTTDNYKSVIETKDGLISKIITTGGGRSWDLVSEIAYSISDADKEKMAKAVVLEETLDDTVEPVEATDPAAG